MQELSPAAVEKQISLSNVFLSWMKVQMKGEGTLFGTYDELIVIATAGLLRIQYVLEASACKVFACLAFYQQQHRQTLFMRRWLGETVIEHGTRNTHLAKEKSHAFHFHLYTMVLLYCKLLYL